MTDQPKSVPDTINICVNFRAGSILPSCGARGSRELADALEAGIAERRLPFAFKRLHCMGKCHIGPTMRLSPGGAFIMGAQAEDVPRILDFLQAGDFDGLAAAFPLPEQDLNLDN
jgi:(2Fe-2S) ferredoxin